MKEKISAIISFISAIGWGLAGLYALSDNDLNSYGMVDYFAMFSLLTASISTILYVTWTKFGQRDKTELIKIDYENQILKKQIEQQELLKQLEK